MANIVTVTGASSSTVSLSYDTTAAANLAAQLAYAISQGVTGGSITPHQGTGGITPVVPTGTTGEWVQTGPGTTILQPAYTDLVAADSVTSAASVTSAVNPSGSVIIGSGAPSEAVLLGNSSITFQAIAGSGSGTIAGGAGNDRIVISGNNTGAWTIQLGNGDDTVIGGGGHMSVGLGSGADNIQIGSADTVYAGTGAETITGPSFVASTPGSTAPADVFVFTKGSAAGGSDLIVNFASTDKILLQGYGQNEVTTALTNAVFSNGSETITLTDNTKITLQNFHNLTSSNFG